jgi:hypothetical protein
MLRNEEIAQILNKAIKVKIKTKNYREQFFCYVTKLNTYVIILKDEWLQTHDLLIDWKKREMRFFFECIKMSCIQNKQNTKTKNNKSINIKIISETQFFKLTKKSDDETFLFHLRQDFEERLTSLCIIAINKISSEDYAKFLKTKSKYTIDQFKERVFKKYHDEIKIFVRRNANKLTKQKKKIMR